MTEEERLAQLELIEKAIQSAVSRVEHKASQEAMEALKAIKELSTKFNDHVEVESEDRKRLDERFNPQSETYILKDVVEIIEAYKKLDQAYEGGKILGTAIKWLAGLAIAWAAIRGFRL